MEHAQHPGMAPSPPPIAPTVSRPPGLPSHQGRVRACIAAWRQIGAPKHVLRWIQEGVRIEWIDGPPPPFHHGISRVSPEDIARVSSERDRCLLSGAWTRAKSFDYVSRAFVTTHNGKRRLVFNLKYLNKFCAKRGARFGGLAGLRRELRFGDEMWSIDLTDAYHHVALHEESQRFFTFALETDRGVEYFHTSALNFGWTRSPEIFTEFLKPVIAYMRNPHVARGAALSWACVRLGLPLSSSGMPHVSSRLRVRPWLDDIMCMYQGSHKEAIRARDFSWEVLERLGLRRQPMKGQPEPSRLLHDHLGYGVDSERGMFLLTVRRERKLRLAALEVLRCARTQRRLIGARQLASFGGLAQSTELALPLARLWLRALWDDLATKRGWTSHVRLSRQTLRDVRGFCSLMQSKHVGRPIWTPPDTAVGSVDAGPYGWGGKLWSPREHAPAAGYWSAEHASLHITWRELRAVRLFVEWYLEELRGRRLLLYEDNQAVVYILSHMTSRSPELMEELRKLIAVLGLNEIHLRALWVSSGRNQVADHYSRLARAREYRLKPALFAEAQRLWGPCSVDAFASAASAQLDRFWSEVPAPEAAATDAFAQLWRGERVWAHPPPHLLPQVAQQLREDPSLSAVVCAPYWPGAAWFAELASMSMDMVVWPPGSLERVAFDAPRRLESWGVAAFCVDPGARR